MVDVRGKGESVVRDLDYYVNLPYRLEVIPGENGEFVVRYPELPGCISQVTRPDEVMPAAAEILEGWLEIALEDGQDIPIPRETNGYSGRFLARISRTLHRELAEAAAWEGVSLNSYITTLLATENSRRENRRLYEDLCFRFSTVMRTLHDVTYQGVPQPPRAEVDPVADEYSYAA